MLKWRVALGAATLGLIVASTASADQRKVTLATLEWPPYTGSTLPKQGATTEVIRQAFSAVGVEIDVRFMPWKRAIAQAANGEPAAYFPGYHCKHKDGFVASAPIGDGPLGLAEHIDAPIAWTSIDDLGEQKLKIGTVRGYANTAEFDEKAGTGWVRAIPANDDATNLKKLIRKRIDAAVIDKFVLAYLVKTHAALTPGGEKLRFDERPLEQKTLFLCFTDTDEGKALRDLFNGGLEQLDVGQVVDDYFDSAF